MTYGKRFLLLGGEVGRCYSHLDPLDVGVHAADTLAFGDLEKDETVVAPVRAPRVLDLPVVLVAIGILKAASVVTTLAAVPPLVDSALLVYRVRSRIRSRIGLRLRVGSGIRVTLVGVTNNDHSVIQACSTASIGGDDTLFVELEDTFTGINGNSQRVSLELLLDIVDTVSDLAIPGYLADSFRGFVSALSFSTGSTRSVWVISISHDTLLFLELPGVAHPAATAAPEPVIFTVEHLLIEAVVSQSTVNKLLLRKALRCVASILGNVTFKCRVGGESPAGTTATLLLDWIHVTILDVINSCGIGYETTATATSGGTIFTNSLVAS
jgi:hypothetical protein